MAEKLPNPKYIPKPYEQMQYPGQRVQIDVKFVPKSCLVGAAAEEGGYYYFRIKNFGNNTFNLSCFARRCKQRQPQNMAYITSDLSVRK